MEAYIVAAARTAGGRKGGRLSGWHPSDMAGAVLDSLVERTGADPALIEDVIMGCVGQAGEQGLQHRAQRGVVVETAGKRAGHQRRPPMRLLAAGPAFRGPGGDERRHGCA